MFKSALPFRTNTIRGSFSQREWYSNNFISRAEKRDPKWLKKVDFE
jgi:hypothetical protein